MDDLFLIGRLLFGGFFLYSGVHHFTSTAAMAQYTAAKGVPMPEAAVLFAGLLLLIGGLSLLLGLWPQLGVACIALFFIGVTPIMHDFWNATDPGQQALEMGNFLKNFALLGGTLMMLAIPRPWPYSVESRRRIAA